MNSFTKKILPFCLTAVVVVCFSFAGYAQNLLTNSGFEEWSGGAPAGWSGSKTNIGASNIVQSSTAHGGSSACQLINDASGHKRFTSASLSVTSGQTYTVKFWVRGNGDVRTGFWDGLGTDGANYVYNDYFTVSSASWEQKEQTVTAPATVSNAELIFSLRNTSGDHLIIDDVEMLGGGTVSLIADFKADMTTAPVGSTIKFTDLSTGTPLQWAWSVTGPQDFESNVQHPSFKFDQAGTYSVTLTVSDEETSATEEKTGYITIGNFVFFQDWNDKDWKGWSAVNVTGEQQWSISDRYGMDDTPCSRMSGHDGTSSVVNEDWLISPAFSLESGNKAILNFENAVSQHPGPALELYFSNNYNGSNVSAATWTPLSFTLSPSEQYYVWTNSGNVSLSAFSGENCHIAFKYTSSAAASSVWEVDNISLTNEGGTSINTEEELKFNVYPNPTTGIFTIETEGNVVAKIYSIDGRLVKEEVVNEQTRIDMTTHAKGIYFLQLVRENGIKAIRKIIVQ